MVLFAGDLRVEVDAGLDRSGAALQRFEDGHWRNYQQDGKPVTWPVELEVLEPGRYRVRD